MLGLQSILKRNSDMSRPEAKVGFQIPTANEVDVEKALRAASQCDGMDSNYRSLIAVLKSEETDDAALVSLLRRIKNSAHVMERHNNEVSECLLSMKLLMKGPDVLDMYVMLVCDLACLHPYFLRGVFVALLNVFMSPEAVSADILEAQREEKFEKLHSIFREIFQLIPTSPPTLVDIVADRFPYMKQEGLRQACLVRQLLRVVSYIPSHRQELLQLLVCKTLELDVHCPKEDILEAEEEAEEDSDMETDVFPMDKEIKAKTDPDPLSMKHPLANSLDLMLDQFFFYIEEQCHSKGKGEPSAQDWERTKLVHKDFLTIFDRVVLPTHKCCHLQFLIFYLCSIRPALADGFLDYLWKKVQNPNTSSVMRQAAAFYIGSFLARAKFVPLSTVRDCLSLVCRWAHAYIASLGEGSQLQVDMQRHRTFYAVCQTILYIFAFHHRELTAGESGLSFLRDLNLEALVMSPLNPLRVCLPAVVQRFASVARHYQLVYCYSVIERNHRTSLPLASPSAFAESPPTDLSLDVFFPFDPYVLKRSGKWINPLYRHFEGSSDGPHFDDEAEADQEEEMCNSPSKSPRMPKVSIPEMFSYGTSPGFKRSLSISRS